MRKISLLVLLLCFTGCTSLHDQMESNIAEQTQIISKRTAQDPIKVIQTYNGYNGIEDACNHVYSPGTNVGDGFLGGGVIGAGLAGLGALVMVANKNSGTSETADAFGKVLIGSGLVAFALGGTMGVVMASEGNPKCEEALALAKDDIKYGCLYKKGLYYSGEEHSSQYYNSDECILYRRTAPTSVLKFFNYSKFLKPETKIKTEEQFKLAVDYYNQSIKRCNDAKETTTTERTNCINNVYKIIREYSEHGFVSCTKYFRADYKSLLQEKVEWYNWAIDHDPYGLYKEWSAMTGVSDASIRKQAYQPVYSKDSASKEIKEDIEKWGKEHLCSTATYMSDLREMGFDL